MIQAEVQTGTATTDPLLAPWLAAAGDEAELWLTQLIGTELRPLMAGVIRFKLRLGPDAPDAEDLRQEALAELLGQLRKCRTAPAQHAIGDVRGLAATITYRACYRWLRRQAPRRTALRNRLQYVLTRQAGLALWPAVSKDLVKRVLSGLLAWRGRNDWASAAQLQQLAADETLRACAGRMGEGKGPAAFGEFLRAVFTSARLPIEFDELVSLSGALLQVRDEQAVSTATEEGGEIPLPAAPDDVAWQVEKRLFLQRLWEEVRLLPLPQRAALLLNLRDAGGRGCIALFPTLGIANLRALAAALELPLERLAALWNQLPLDDATIAELLKLTRQQVINARKAARERLTRRLRGFL
ncbi:MAG: hypothetical protein HYR56_24825 [Acidobacteria bacterium]|nr:hypothetical protein [Acidobacteriota bacterium]MBI3428137.1 hypothetical protein [Acidobacteriota bacterium]